MSGLLGRALDIHGWLSADAATPDAERFRRDRRIGASLEQGSDVDRILAWWHAVQAAEKSAPCSNGQMRVQLATRWVGGGLVLAGLFVGASTAGVALAYDGRYPVNLLALLGICVALPGALLLLTAFMCIAQSCGWLNAAQGISVLNVNRIVLGVWQRLAQIPEPGGGWRLVLHWYLVLFSQWFAMAFFAGVLVTLLLLVAFTDLAFGWSSTLNISAGQVSVLFESLAFPWSALVPSASPSLELVELSRYYRLDDHAIQDAARLGLWWPFVLLSILVWGLLPRVGFSVLAHWRLRIAERVFLREHPEVTALLHRLAQPAVGFADVSDEADLQTDAMVLGDAAPGAQRACVIWDGAPGNIEGIQVSSAMDSVSRQGVIDKLPAGDVQVVTKGYEPPMLAFHDFVQELRAQVGAESAIVIVPVGVAGDAADPVDIDIWRQSLAALRDMRLYVSEVMA